MNTERSLMIVIDSVPSLVERFGTYLFFFYLIILSFSHNLIYKFII